MLLVLLLLGSIRGFAFFESILLRIVPVPIGPRIALTASCTILLLVLILAVHASIFAVLLLSLLRKLAFAIFFFLLEFDELLLQLMDYLFLLVQHLKVLDEWLHRRVVGALFLDVRHLNVEGHGQEVEHVLLVEVAVLLHRVQQIELLRQQVMVFHVIYYLPRVQVAQGGGLVVLGVGVLVQHRRTTAHGCVEARDLSTHAVVLSMLRLPGRQAVKSDSMRNWLPLEVEERVNRLYLNPPAPAFECFPYQLRVISW